MLYISLFYLTKIQLKVVGQIFYFTARFDFSLSNINLSKKMVSFLSLALAQIFCFSASNSPIPERIFLLSIFSSKSMHFSKNSLKPMPVLASTIVLFIGQLFLAKK